MDREKGEREREREREKESEVFVRELREFSVGNYYALSDQWLYKFHVASVLIFTMISIVVTLSIGSTL